MVCAGRMVCRWREMDMGLELGKHALVDFLRVTPTRSPLDEDPDKPLLPVDQIIAFRPAPPGTSPSLMWETYSFANLDDFAVKVCTSRGGESHAVVWMMDCGLCQDLDQS